jgi:hypothetical protein
MVGFRRDLQGATAVSTLYSLAFFIHDRVDWDARRCQRGSPG